VVEGNGTVEIGDRAIDQTDCAEGVAGCEMGGG
jgi:hypothetical protein